MFERCRRYYATLLLSCCRHATRRWLLTLPFTSLSLLSSLYADADAMPLRYAIFSPFSAALITIALLLHDARYATDFRCYADFALFRALPRYATPPACCRCAMHA